MQERYKFRLICVDIINEQSAQLRISVLFDDVDRIVLFDEVSYFIAKWKRLETTIVDTHTLALQAIECFFTCAVAASKRKQCCRIEFRIANIGLRQYRPGSFPLYQQPVDDILIRRRVFCVLYCTAIKRSNTGHCTRLLGPWRFLQEPCQLQIRN